MKRLICGVLTFTLTVALLTACASSGTAEDPILETTQPVQTEPVTQPPETTQPEMVQGWFRDTPAHRAFREALTTVHDQLYWPASDGMKIVLWDGDESIEEEQFAVCDVDGDGEEELLISVVNTYMAGMCQITYGYDAGTDGLRIEAQEFPAVTYYPGLFRVEASHSHGLAGDVLWPYGIYFYDAQADEYRWVYGVDGWDKTITDYDSYREMPFPEDIDTQAEGYVYIVSDADGERMMNRVDYEAWESAIFAQMEPLDIPWQKLTAENIGIE